MCNRTASSYIKWYGQRIFDLIGSLNDLLANVRYGIDDYHDKQYKEALGLAKNSNIVEVVPRFFKANVKRKLPIRFQLGILQIVHNYLIVLGQSKGRFEVNQTSYLVVFL